MKPYIVCPNCGNAYKANSYYLHNCNYRIFDGFLNPAKEQPKMTRDELRKICSKHGISTAIIPVLEELGLIKLDPDNEITGLFKISTDDKTFNSKVMNEINNKYGTIKLELWPEGLVLWVGGKIRWESWKEYSDISNQVK